MTELLTTVLTWVHVLACMFLILVVLLQPGKSGGMGALGGAGAQQVFGGRGAGSFLSRLTWWTAGTFFVTSLSLAYLSSSTGDTLEARGAELSSKTPGTPPVSPAK